MHIDGAVVDCGKSRVGDGIDGQRNAKSQATGATAGAAAQLELNRSGRGSDRGIVAGEHGQACSCSRGGDRAAADPGCRGFVGFVHGGRSSPATRDSRAGVS